MSEWLKEHAWKACVRVTVPWVRIPLSPPHSPCECGGSTGLQASRDGQARRDSARIPLSLRIGRLRGRARRIPFSQRWRFDWASGVARRAGPSRLGTNPTLSHWPPSRPGSPHTRPSATAKRAATHLASGVGDAQTALSDSTPPYPSFDADIGGVAAVANSVVSCARIPGVRPNDRPGRQYSACARPPPASGTSLGTRPRTPGRRPSASGGGSPVASVASAVARSVSADTRAGGGQLTPSSTRRCRCRPPSSSRAARSASRVVAKRCCSAATKRV